MSREWNLTTTSLSIAWAVFFPARQHWDIKLQTVTKFVQNQSTSATATASLVRPLKSIRVHYRHTRDWLSSVGPCEWLFLQDFSTSKVCVQNVDRVLEVERKLQDVDATAWPLYRWPPHGNVPTLRSGATLAGRPHESGCGTHDPSTKSVDWVKVRTVCRLMSLRYSM